MKNGSNFCNRRTARLLRAVLATESLKRSAERGRQRISKLLKNYGILHLEDLAALEKDKISNLLGQMGQFQSGRPLHRRRRRGCHARGYQKRL